MESLFPEVASGRAGTPREHVERCGVFRERQAVGTPAVVQRDVLPRPLLLFASGALDRRSVLELVLCRVECSTAVPASRPWVGQHLEGKEVSPPRYGGGSAESCMRRQPPEPAARSITY